MKTYSDPLDRAGVSSQAAPQKQWESLCHNHHAQGNPGDPHSFGAGTSHLSLDVGVSAMHPKLGTPGPKGEEDLLVP